MEIPVIIDEDDVRQYTCDFCNKYDENEVGETQGYDGETARVCNNCDIDGCDYNGWGGYYGEKCENCDEITRCDCCEECKNCELCKCDEFEKQQKDDREELQARKRRCYNCGIEYIEDYDNYIHNIITTKCGGCPYKECDMCEYGKDEVNDIDDVLIIKCKKCEDEDKQAEEQTPDYTGATCVYCEKEDYDINGRYFDILDNKKKWICLDCEQIILYKEYNRLFN